MSDRAEQLARLRQERARLRRRMAEVASLTAETGEHVAETFEQIAEHRSPPDADRLRAEASVIREYAAKERSRAVSYGRSGGDDGQAERAMARAPAKAGTNAPGSRTATLANLAVSSDAGESR